METGPLLLLVFLSFWTVCEGKDTQTPCDGWFKTLTDMDKRSPSFTDTLTLCDRYINPGWYRMDEYVMPMSAPPLASCGTLYPYWMDGSLPGIGFTKTVKACQVGFSDICAKSHSINISNCDGFYMYQLKPLDGCNSAYCFDKDDCLGVQCQNNGTCQDLIDDYKCNCTQGFSGKNCSTKTEDKDDCLGVQCQNNGTCQDLIDDYKCNCTQGFSGKNCSTKTEDKDDCLGVQCQNNGTCQDLIDDYKCNCTQGFSGKNCSTKTEDKDDCLGVQCQNNGTCQDLIDDYKCNCTQGFSGKNCSTKIKDFVKPILYSAENDWFMSQFAEVLDGNNSTCIKLPNTGYLKHALWVKLKTIALNVSKSRFDINLIGEGILCKRHGGNFTQVSYSIPFEGDYSHGFTKFCTIIEVKEKHVGGTRHCKHRCACADEHQCEEVIIFIATETSSVPSLCEIEGTYY